MSKRKEQNGLGNVSPKRHAATSGHATQDEPSWVDCVFQVNHESHANRIIRYFENETIRKRMFPHGSPCAESASILGYGNSVEKVGTLMVILPRIASSPAEWVTWIYSSLFQHVVMRMYFLEGGEDEKHAATVEELVDRLGDEFTVQGPVRLTCCPKALETQILDICEKMGDASPFEFQPVTFKHVLHAIQLPDGSLRYSMRSPEETYHTRSDGSARIPGQFCKAAGKLQEALMVTGYFENHVDGHGIAIDVGSAPGGWTHQLARHMESVLSIDPANLHPSVLDLKNVIHIKKMSQNAGAEIESILGDRKVSLLSCDANRHPERLGEMLAPALKYLQKGGLLVLTLKFTGRGENKVRKCLEGLSDAFFQGDAVADSPLTDMQALFLLANTQNERTVVARKA